MVDNASSEGSIELIKSRFHRVRLIQNPRNDMTAEVSNVGARKEGGVHSFLSDDMEVNSDFLTYLIEVADRSKNIEICTCRMKRITEKGEKLNEIECRGR